MTILKKIQSARNEIYWEKDIKPTKLFLGKLEKFEIEKMINDLGYKSIPFEYSEGKRWAFQEMIVYLVDDESYCECAK